jgi:hypothetical protein
MSEIDPNAPIYPAAVRSDPLPMPRQLCDHFVYQKNLALERAGVDLTSRAPMSPEKAWDLYGDAMTRMAGIVEKWDADPGVVMEACFAYSRSKRHADGPQLNMLGSPKYMLQAIAYHLEMPKDAVADMMSKESMVKRLSKVAAGYEASLRQTMKMKWGSDDPSQLIDETKAIEINMVTSVPALYRFLLCVTSRPLGLALIPEILETLRVDAKQRLWAQHCGWSYRGMATYYQVIRPRQEEGPA